MSNLTPSPGSLDNYLQEKTAYEARYAAAGVKIIPADQLPLVEGKHTETPGLISEGHVHNQAMRKMIKLFLSCLWVTWRTSLNLPISNPYSIDIQKHAHLIDPWSMCDREKPIPAITKKEINKASIAYRIAIILGIDPRKVEAAWTKAQYEIEAERAKTEPLEISKPKFSSEPDTES